jgi:hypothetical protein
MQWISIIAHEEIVRAGLLSLLLISSKSVIKGRRLMEEIERLQENKLKMNPAQ